MNITHEKVVFFFTGTDLVLPEILGGKGQKLAQLAKRRFPVPEGFVIIPAAFDGNKLNPRAWDQIKFSLEQLIKRTNNQVVAVRSSANVEDSPDASFGGQFETKLHVQGEDDIKAAILHVYQSRLSDRVRAYSHAKGLEQTPQMAIIVQEFIPAETSGVLFTIDPITGDRSVMIGNTVVGSGETLVSGTANASNFTLHKPTGRYEGSKNFRKYAKDLYHLARRIEAHFHTPQDIEFAINRKKIYILQSRPITTLRGHNPQVGEWNDSLLGNYVWTNTNSSEAAPSILTPSSWSIAQTLYENATPLKNFFKYIPFIGNIGGRFYFNISFSYALYRTIMNEEKTLSILEEIYGNIPEELRGKLIHTFSRGQQLVLFPSLLSLALNYRKIKKKLSQYLDEGRQKSITIGMKIDQAKTPTDLIALWEDQLKPLLFQSYWMMLTVLNDLPQKVILLKRELAALVGEIHANVLLSNIGKDLASLGPLIGLYCVARGEMTKEAYNMNFGHRCVEEFELSVPRPAEIPNWLENQLNDLDESTFDIERALANQQTRFSNSLKVLERVVKKKQLQTIKRQLEEANLAGTAREEVRSEYARTFNLIRKFYLKAGEITNLAVDIFFLTIDEVLEVLSGDQTSFQYISVRKQTHQKYMDLPFYPTYINGNFYPFDWAADSSHRSDVYDSSQSLGSIPSENLIRGIGGAKGQVTGVVRCLMSPDDGTQLQPGEILVTRTTNIGWTPLFPRLKAIITDVGAPLSHAAIIVRELGIPAVIGCGNATTRLKTGDRVSLDGARGIIEILDS